MGTAYSFRRGVEQRDTALFDGRFPLAASRYLMAGRIWFGTSSF
jgi:hypothetical protein